MLLFLLDFLVLLLAVPSCDHAKDNREPAAQDNHTSSGLVPRLLGCEEEVGREPVGNRRHAVGNGDERGSLGAWSGHHADFPRNLNLKPLQLAKQLTRPRPATATYIQTDERPSAEQEHGEVPCRDVERRNHDDSPDQTC